MKTNIYSKLLITLFLFLFAWQGNDMLLTAQQTKGESIPKLENPFNREYLQNNSCKRSNVV